MEFRKLDSFMPIYFDLDYRHKATRASRTIGISAADSYEKSSSATKKNEDGDDGPPEFITTQSAGNEANLIQQEADHYGSCSSKHSHQSMNLLRFGFPCEEEESVAAPL